LSATTNIILTTFLDMVLTFFEPGARVPMKETRYFANPLFTKGGIYRDGIILSDPIILRWALIAV